MRGRPRWPQNRQCHPDHAPPGSLASPSPGRHADGDAQRLQADYQAYVLLGDRLAAQVSQIETHVPHTDARFLDSVPGIGFLLAARYQAAIISVDRFCKSSQIWALAGFDLITDESGDTKRLGKITKRGQPTFRDALYQIGSPRSVARTLPATARPSATLISTLANVAWIM